MTRLRSSTFELRATADKSSFGPSTSSGPSRAPSRDGEARIVRPPVRLGVLQACLVIAAQLRRRAFATAAAVMIGGSSVLACPMCFGAEETSMINGTKLGVLVMLGVLLAVQGGFVAFFLYLRKRAKRIADVELDTEWSELQRSPRTS
jgi:hypothetical protein